MNINDSTPNEVSSNARGDAKRSSSSPDITPSKKLKASSNSNVKIVSRVTPKKAPRDPNEYRVIKLSNELTIVLISREKLQNYGSLDSSFLGFKSSGTLPILNQSKPECHFLPQLPFPIECSPNLPGYDEDVGRTVGGPLPILQRECRTPPEQTSIAMVVNVGGLDDPYEFQGLAHFTEHMVHYGTEKFPEEDAVNLVVANFGSYNATTRQHTTSYYNEVPDQILNRNLELFSSMVAHPLFPPDVINREVNAVDNEFYLRLPVWRKLLLQTHVCIENKKHQLARFICGSLETLGGRDKVVQKVMRDNHRKNYVASAMTLSINSTKSLDELETLALAHFSDIPQGDHPVYSKSQPDKSEKLVFGKKQHVYLEGISNAAFLTVLWHLPAHEWLQDRKQRVLPLIMRMLSDTSKTSLGHHLHSQELIWELAPNYTTTLYATTVEIHFYLTEKGCQNTEQITQAIQDYLEVLQNGANENEMRRLFDEMRVLNLKEYHYGSQLTSLETTKDLAMRLQYIENETDVLSSESWEDAKFNFKSVQTALAMLKKDDLIVVETLRKDVNVEDKGKVQKAPYSNARYVVAERIENGSSQGKKTGGGNGRNAGGKTNFAFVPENKYLTLDVQTMASSNSIVNEAGDGGYVMRRPENCGDIPPQRLNWRSRHDPTHGEAIPKIQGIHHGHTAKGHDPFYSTIEVKFINPRVRVNNATTMNRALSWLWTRAIVHNVRPYLSEIASAGFQFSIQPGQGLTVSIGGFPRHMDEILCTIISNIFEMPISPTVFSLAKQQLYMELEYYLSESDQVTHSLLMCMLFQQEDMSIDCFGSLQKATLEELNVFIQVFKRSAFAVVELSGNLHVGTFKNVAEHLEKMPFVPIMDNNPSLYSSSYSPVTPDFYTPGEKCIRVKFIESTTYTTSVTNFYALGPYGSNQRQADCFSAAIYFMNCQAFMDLRTRQQLGYVVYVRKWLPQRAKVPLMMFSVTVTCTARKFTPCELDQRIDKFLAEYAEYLQNINPDLYGLMGEMTCTPSEAAVTQTEVSKWFNEKFSKDFGKVDIKRKCALAGIKKISVQVLSGNKYAGSKHCPCEICASIGDNDWKEGSGEGSKFLYAVGRGVSKDYFISLPKF